MSSNQPNPNQQAADVDEIEKQLRAQGVKLPSYSEKKQKLVNDLIEIGQMARTIATARIAIKNFDNYGHPTLSAPNPVGHEELYTMVLAQWRLAQETSGTFR